MSVCKMFKKRECFCAQRGGFVQKGAFLVNILAQFKDYFIPLPEILRWKV